MFANLKSGVAATTLSLLATGAIAESWPDLPTAIKNGVSGQSGTTAVIGLGSGGDALFSMDLADPVAGWQVLASFPGPVPSGAASALAGGKLYVFSGSGKVNADDVAPIIFTDVHAYDLATNSWAKLDTQTPAGLLGATGFALDDDRIAIFGGYNKELFDQYLNDVLTTDKEAEPEKWQKIVDDYMGMKPSDYRWNSKTLVYTISTNSWSDLGDNPYLPNTGAALVESGDDILLINGEIKPGLRTPQIKQVSFSGDTASWQQVAPIPTKAGDDLSEGLAAPYAGWSNGALIVAGGANFPGARANAFAGQWFSHQGLTKTWNDDVYVRLNGAWKQVNDLPEGLAYGATFTTDDGLLVVGGEGSDRKPRAGSFLISWDGEKVNFTD